LNDRSGAFSLSEFSDTGFSGRSCWISMGSIPSSGSFIEREWVFGSEKDVFILKNVIIAKGRKVFFGFLVRD
jgi:hypothetical protein